MNKFITFCCVCLVGPGFIASAEVVAVSPGGFLLKNQFETSQSAETVWLALTKEVDNWWPKDHSWWRGTFSIEERAGGCFCERLEDKSAEHLRISFVDPNKRLLMTGGLGPLQAMGMYGALDWQLKVLPGGTQVTLTYQVQGYSPQGFDDLAPVVDSVQRLQLMSLKQFIDGPAAPDAE